MFARLRKWLGFSDEKNKSDKKIEEKIVKPKEVPEPPPTQNTKIPKWITKEYFQNILTKDVEGFLQIVKFTVEAGAGAGENYASVMLRIHIKCELLNGSFKDVSYMMKTTHEEGSVAASAMGNMDIYDKESGMYDLIIPAFEKLYADKGKKVSFGPNSFKLDKDPGVENIVLEDLGQRKFKNADRLKGLDMDHCKMVLKLLAEFHAASVVYYETKGPFEQKYNLGVTDLCKREVFVQMISSTMPIINQCITDNVENGSYYAEKMNITADQMIETLNMMGTIHKEDFNVLNHGDLWCNNIMFKYNSCNEVEETLFVDFQMCKYGSPVQDLLYFLISSVNLDIKTEYFDYFIKIYHDNLAENLKLLEYSKKMPSLLEIQLLIYKHHIWATWSSTGIMAAVLLEPSDTANMENMIGSMDLQTAMYSSPRYVKALNSVLPWLDNRGMLG